MANLGNMKIIIHVPGLVPHNIEICSFFSMTSHLEILLSNSQLLTDSQRGGDQVAVETILYL